MLGRGRKKNFPQKKQQQCSPGSIRLNLYLADKITKGEAMAYTASEASTCDNGIPKGHRFKSQLLNFSSNSL